MHPQEKRGAMTAKSLYGWELNNQKEKAVSLKLTAFLLRQLEKLFDCVGSHCVISADCNYEVNFILFTELLCPKEKIFSFLLAIALWGAVTEINLRSHYVKNARLVGSTLRSKALEIKAQILAELVEKVWPKVASGEVKPTIHAVLPITEAEAAHDILYKSQNIGKVVLEVK